MIFDIIDELRVAFKDDKDLIERLLGNIKPDSISSSNTKFDLEYSLLKITSRVAKLGKDFKIIYDTLDQDKSGTLDMKELLFGLRNSFNVYLS